MLQFLVGLILVLGGTIIPTTAYAEPPSDAFRMLTSNIASGVECRPPTDCLSPLRQQINAYHPDVVGGQEFCRSDIRAFKKSHPNMKVYFEPMLKHPGCEGEAKGTMLAGVGLSNRHIYDLPGDTPAYGTVKDFKMLCALTPRLVKVCVVHFRAGALTPDIAARNQQVGAVLQITDDWQRRHAILGDFNLISESPYFERFVDAGYRDVEPVRRVIHVLLKGQLRRVSGAFLKQETSDHPLLRTWVTYR